MKLTIVIPAYNEEGMLVKATQRLPKGLIGISQIEKVVIDDGSVDKTSHQAQSIADTLIRHPINVGLGGALATGFAYAKQSDCDILVTFDSDGQHKASDIEHLIRPIIENKADVVIGSRMMGKGYMPPSRKMVNYIANIITGLMGGQKSSDSQSGLRAFNKKAVALIEIKTTGMEVSSEILCEIKRHRLRLQEIPIAAIYTEYSQTKGQRISNAPNVFFQLFKRLIR